MAGGVVPIAGDHVLYELWIVRPVLKFDRVVHAFGFGSSAFASWQVLRRLVPAGHTRGVALAAGLMGMGFGALNEVVEFAASHAGAEHVGGYENTGWDLVFNLIGCVAAGAWAAARDSRRATLSA
jgi:putative membrane protein